MSSKLPSPDKIADHYDQLLKELDGEYIFQRWGESETQRRHYKQTELAISHALERIPRIGDVLEIGCGPAVWTTLFLEKADTVHLLDISAEMLRAARARLEKWKGGVYAGKVAYSHGDFLEIDLPAQSFETIVSARAFEYMTDKRAFVDRCLRLLRPGGTLVLVTKNRAWYDNAMSRRRLSNVAAEDIPVGAAMQLDLLTSSKAESTFRQAGFADVVAYPVIIGSYDMPFLRTDSGLTFSDFLHRRLFKLRMKRLIAPLVESFLVVGRKPQ